MPIYHHANGVDQYWRKGHGVRDGPEASSRLGLLVAASAATVGVIYGYDPSNIAGALLFTTEFELSTHDQELVTTAVVVGQIVGALGRRRAGQPDRPQGLDGAGGGRVRGVLAAVRRWPGRCRRCSPPGCCWA